MPIIARLISRNPRRAARIGIGLCASFSLATGAPTPAAAAASVSRAHIVARYPHDAAAFTEGLFYRDGALVESTGRYGVSSLRRVDLASGDIERSVGLAPRWFGEGTARLGDRIYQLTWKAGTAIVYTADTLRPIAQRRYRGQGWGLTDDGRHLIMSDGSATLRVLAPATFHTVRRLVVRRDGEPVKQLNELEYIDGEIWANVWHSDRIVRVDAASGRVVGIVDATDLRAALPAYNDAGVLNGIAWDAERRRILLTGKNWPRLFAIRAPRDLGRAGASAERPAAGSDRRAGNP